MIFIGFAIAATVAGQDVPAPQSAATGERDSKSRLGSYTYVDFESHAGYATNPLSRLDDDAGRAFARLSLNAVHGRQSARANTLLTAYAETVGYSGTYGTQQLFLVTTHHDLAATERLRLFGDFSASYDQGGQLGTRFIGPAPVTAFPSESVIIPGLPVDTQVVNFDARNYRFAGQVGAKTLLGESDSVTLRTAYDHVSARSSGLDANYSSITASSAYDRVLNERTSVGAILTAQHSALRGPGGVTSFTPQVTGTFALSESTSVNGAIGISHARIDDGTSETSSTGLALSAGVCHKGEASRTCAYLSRRQASPSVAGVVRSLAADLSYSRRIGPNENLQLSVGASRYSSEEGVAFVTATHGSYFHVSGAYSRQLRERLHTGVNLSARKFAQDGPDASADLSGSLFLRYRLGDVL